MRAFEIYFNFVGKYVPPHFGEVALTAEEQEELRKKEERRDRLHQNYSRRKANGKQREYEERTKSEKRKKMEEKKAALRVEDMAKGMYICSQAVCHSQNHREPPLDNEKECKTMKLEYIKNGDYLISNLALSEQMNTIKAQVQEIIFTELITAN